LSSSECDIHPECYSIMRSCSWRPDCVCLHRRSQAGGKSKARVARDDSNVSISDSEGGSRQSKRSRALSASQAAASTSQAPGSTADSRSQLQPTAQQNSGDDAAQEVPDTMSTGSEDDAVHAELSQPMDSHNTAGSEPPSGQEQDQQQQVQKQSRRQHSAPFMSEPALQGATHVNSRPSSSRLPQQQLAERLRRVHLTVGSDQTQQQSSSQTLDMGLIRMA